MGGSAAMDIVLSPATQKLLEHRMKKGGYSSPDEVMRIALEQWDRQDADPDEDLDEKGLAAIEEGLAQAERGECRTLDDVRAEFRAKGLCK
jgi:predicted transcriptional regulator